MANAAVFESPELGGTFQHFVDFLTQPDTPGSVLPRESFSQSLHFDLQRVAVHAHVHRNTIGRAPSSHRVQNFLREARWIIKAATDLNGDLNKTLFWYRNEPFSVFGCKTAERLVFEGRTADLLRYIAPVKFGAAG